MGHRATQASWDMMQTLNSAANRTTHEGRPALGCPSLQCRVSLFEALLDCCAIEKALRITAATDDKKRRKEMGLSAPSPLWWACKTRAAMAARSLFLYLSV